MELSLHGSQISLATRDKIQTPPIYYPPVHIHRPASASLSYHRNRLTSRTSSNLCHNRRPLSADSRFVNTKGSSSVKFNLGNHSTNSDSSSNIFKLLIDESPSSMSSKYWTSNNNNNTKAEEEKKFEEDFTSKNHNNNKSIMKRPDSLDLTFEYGCSTDLSKTTAMKTQNNSEVAAIAIATPKENPTTITNNSVDVNQSKSLSVAGNKSHHDGKKSTTSYELWVNENNVTAASTLSGDGDGGSGIKQKSENSVAREKKLDLPGRVSFSTNDVYEIDYSDYDDQETVSSQTSGGNLEKLNKSLTSISVGGGEGSSNNKKDGKSYIKEHYMSNSDNEMDEIDYRYHHHHRAHAASPTKSNDKSSKINQIIEEYKIESDAINHHQHHHHSHANSSNRNSISNHPLNNSKTNKIATKLNPVIKNYLKTKEDFGNHLQHDNNYSNHNRVTITTANKKLNDLSKKSKNLREMTKPKTPNMSMVAAFSSMKSTALKPTMQQHQPSSSSSSTNLNNSNNINTNGVVSNGMKKPKSPSASSIYTRQDSKLNEFQIEKVVSWMSVNEENFSEFEFSIAGQVSENKSVTLTAGEKSRRHDEHDSTYQEIVDIIKEIEDEKKDSEDFKTLKTDVEFKLNTILSSIESPEDEIQPNLSNNDDDMTSSSSHKLKEIFSYLDKVDSNCDKTLIDVKGNALMERDNVELEFALEPDVIEDVPKISDLLMLPNHQLARRIVKLSLRANELSNAIQLSKEHVANVRNDKSKALRMEKLNGQNRLKEQKKHYEEIVCRHQTFIEQLIKDKASLCEKVSQITRRLDSQNQAWEHRLKTEVERVKEQALAGEKIRREKWVRENTKKIKELTVKGLELEINKMSSNHKQEIEAMRRQQQLDVLSAIDETKEKYEKAEKSIRESYAEEREQAIERERRAIKERFEKQMDDERKSSEQQRLRLIHDFELEKDRIYGEMREKEHQYELKRDELMNEKLEILEDTKETFKEKLKQREAKFQMEFSKLQEQYESDFKIWKREFETKMKLRESERENTIREQYRLERDRQIDSIVAKVDAESIKNQQDFEMKLNRVKEKLENEIRDLECSEKGIKDKYIDTRTRLAESDANNQNLKAMVTQLELQLSHSTKLCEKFTSEKEKLRDEVRSEIKNELHNIKHDHEMEIQRIYSRVQQAIQKKDAALDTLQKENGALRERNLKLDAIIRQQRKDYCTK